MEGDYVVAIVLLVVAAALVYQSVNIPIIDQGFNLWLFTRFTQTVAAWVIIGFVLQRMQYQISVLSRADSFLSFQICALGILGLMFAIAWYAPKLYAYWKYRRDFWAEIIEETEKPKRERDPTISDEMKKLLE